MLYRSYRCSDGWLMLLCLGLEEEVTPKLQDLVGNGQSRAELSTASLKAFFLAQRKEQAVGALRSAGVPASVFRNDGADLIEGAFAAGESMPAPQVRMRLLLLLMLVLVQLM